MSNSEIPDFEDFDKESQAVLKKLHESKSILRFENPDKSAGTKLNDIKTTKSFSEISNEVALDSPFGENSVFHSNFKEAQQYERYRRDILSLMDKNCIDEFYYTHNPLSNQSIGLVIHARKSNKSLSLNFAPSTFTIEKELRYYSLIKEKCDQKVAVNSGGNFIIKSKDQPIWKTINSKHSNSFASDTKYYQDKYRKNDFTVSIVEMQQVYEDLLSRKGTVMLCVNYVDFNILAKQIQLQLSQQFYNNVNVHVYIKQVDPKQKVIKEILLATNVKKPFDVKLNITIGPSGEVTIKHVASDNLMKQYVNKWKKEAEARGLEINIEELRKQVIHDFESVEIEKSFYKRFIQGSKALFNEKIVGYVEGIQVTQKIGKNVWEEGTVNESTWFSKDKEHVSWPKYAQFNPLVGGVTDGAIDEIAGIPLAIKGVYEIVTDEEKQQTLLKIFTTEGAKQMLDGLAEQAREILNDKDKAQHFGGKMVVSAATMLSGVGFMNKGGKLDDVFDTVNDSTKPFTKEDTFQAIDELNKSSRYRPDENKAISKFVKETDADILDDIGSDLKNVLRKGEDAEVLKKARNLPGTALGGGKDITGNWLKGSHGNAASFPKSVAAKLKGKSFKNFDEFRNSFWKAVSEDDNLIKQFRKADVTRMKKGYAPYVSGTQNIGKNNKYVLHHATPINRGGGVYDMDNLYIVTPKFHKEILDPAYHYGYGF